MVNKIKCPFCNELNEIDYKFCLNCGKELPIGDDKFNLDIGDNVSNSEDEQTTEEQEFINCPACNTLNYQGSIECKECGYLLNKDIKKSFRTSNEKKYKKCPKCGNILFPNDNLCEICGYEFLVIGCDSLDDFLEKHPQYKEYTKNIDFFKDINKFNDYDTFLFQFNEMCVENNINLNWFDVGMIKCPQCLKFFSFISPYFIINHACPHCGNEFDFDSTEEVYCFNCGRPVKEGQTKCECGYEFVDIKCPHCKTYNLYTNNYCTSCESTLRSYNVIFPHKSPQGCIRDDNNGLLLDMEFLKKELLKDPYQINDKVYTKVLQNGYLKLDKIINEICSRWWIVSPNYCKSCQSKIEPLEDNCPKCNITHHSDHYDNRVKELKTIKNNYTETKRGINELSNLKWTYKLSDTDIKDYLNSLAPVIGESQLEYRQRLFKEYGENNVISYLIKNVWNIYFKNRCINCGGEFEQYNLYCPSCGMKKSVPYLSVLFNKGNVKVEMFLGQYDDFSYNVKKICQDNGGDITYASNGIVSCPKCSNYFHYLTSDFINTQKCPNCGVYFNFNATIYEDEWDYLGISYEEYKEQFF